MQNPQELCSLAPGCNMCILRGCSASDSFVTVIGVQMALRRPVFVPSVLTLQAVIVVLWEMNSVCSIHSRVQPCPADEYILLLNNLSHLNRIALLACGKLDGHIGGLLYMLGTMYRWCVAAFSSDLWNVPTSIDHVLDGHIIQMHIKIDTLCKQWWPPKQHSGKKSGHMLLHLLCHRGPLLTICLHQDSDHVCLWPGYCLHHDTAKHSYSGVVIELTGELNDALLCSVMRVGPVCMRVMNVNVYGIDLVNIIFWSAFPHDTQAPPQASWCGGPPVSTRCHIWCFCRVK